MYKIQTSGEILRGIRKKYKLSQQDVAMNDIARTMISQIESGKNNLIKPTAEKIINNINKAIKLKGYNEQLTLEMILQTREQQIENIISEFINEIQLVSMKHNCEKELINLIDEIEIFLLSYKISSEEVCRVYEKISSIYMTLLDYEKAKLYMNKCIAFSYFDSKNVVKYYSALTKINFRLGEYKEVICLYETIKVIMERNELNKCKERVFIYFNASISYSRLKKYDLALGCLEGLEELARFNSLGDSVILDIRIQKANCLMELGKIKLAEQEFRSILQAGLDMQSTTISCTAYLNLAYIEIYKGDFKKVSDYCEIISEMHIEDLNENADRLYFLIDIYIKVNNLRGIEKYYREAFKCLSLVSNKELMRKMCSNITTYFINNHCGDSLDAFIKFLYYNYKDIKFNELSDICILICNYFKEKKIKFNEYMKMATDISKNNMGITEKMW